MATTLGCLLGAYNGSFSFENFNTDIGSWTNASKLPAVLPITFLGGAETNTSEVHSSNTGLIVQVNSSSDETLYSYNHVSSDDYFLKAYPDISTHRLSLDFWAYQNSGALRSFRINIGTSETLTSINCFQSVSSSSTFNHYRINEINVTSNSVIQTQIYVTADTTSAKLFLDDFLPCVDTIDLAPKFEAEINREINFKPEISLTGKYIDFSYGTREKFALDFDVIDEIEAGIINRWWFKQFNLLFTFDSSDTKTNYIVRIANTSKPFSSVRKPYRNKFVGRLELEAINNGNWY